jgi:hypothetical protein
MTNGRFGKASFDANSTFLHHAETVLIEGSSYRMKDRIES